MLAYWHLGRFSQFHRPKKDMEWGYHRNAYLSESMKSSLQVLASKLSSGKTLVHMKWR